MRYHIVTALALTLGVMAAGQKLPVYEDVFPGTASETNVYDAVRDELRNLVFTGWTTSPKFQTSQNAVQRAFKTAVCAPASGNEPARLCPDGFLVRMNAEGTRVLFATYIGGSRFDQAIDAAVDRLGNMYVAGLTGSPDLPVTPAAYRRAITASNRDGFAAKFSPSGQLLWLTYLGFEPKRLAAGSDGSVYVAGSVPQDTMHRYADAMLLKLDSTGSRRLGYQQWGGSLEESVMDLAVGRSGQIYVAGVTNSLIGARPFPVTYGSVSIARGKVDVFVTRFDPGLNIIWSALFGGSGGDTVNSITTDSTGAVYFAGNTSDSNDLPVTAGAVQTRVAGGFLGKLSANGSRLEYLTYYGSTRNDYLLQVEVDDRGRAALFGRSFGTQAPDGICSVAYGPQPGNGAMFIAQLNERGSAVAYSRLVPVTTKLVSGSEALLPRRARPFEAVMIPAQACVVNAFSLHSEAVAPGSVITIAGTNLGPASPAAADPATMSAAPTELAGTRVWIGGVAAPLLYTSARQINVVAPQAVPEGVAALVVERSGARVLQTTVDITPTGPAALTTWNASLRQADAWNEDGTRNSPENPAPAGSRLTVFATGLGAMHPARPDGVFDGPSAVPAARVDIDQNGTSTAPLAFETLPGAVQGVAMVSFAVAQPHPAAARPAAVPVRIVADGVASPSVLVWVR